MLTFLIVIHVLLLFIWAALLVLAVRTFREMKAANDRLKAEPVILPFPKPRPPLRIADTGDPA